MDKYKREMENLHSIACVSEKNYYISESSCDDTYFIKRDENDHAYIREYGFETLPDLKKELDKMWNNDEVMQNCMQTVLIAALKSKPIDKDKKEDEVKQSETQNEKKLSPFIYNF